MHRVTEKIHSKTERVESQGPVKSNKRSGACIAGVSEKSASRAKQQVRKRPLETSQTRQKMCTRSFQETEGTPNRINPKKSTPRHCITKLMKAQDRIFWSSWKEREHNSTGSAFLLRATEAGEAAHGRYTCLRRRTSVPGKTHP